MRRSNVVTGLLLSAGFFASSCSGPGKASTTAASTVPVPSMTVYQSASTTTHPSPPVTERSLPSESSVSCPTIWESSPYVPPGSASLEPLLLTAASLPARYTTSGPTTHPDGPEFYDETPKSLPVAYVSFLMGPDRFGNRFSITEAVGGLGSSASASRLRNRVDYLAQKCGFMTGRTVNLPGLVPNLKVSLNYGGGSRGDSSSSATMITAEGPYLIEVNWYDSRLNSTGSPTDVPLPTLNEMGEVVDAALARLSG